MSEPSEFLLKQIVEIFLHEYNKTSEEKFYWDDKRSYQAKNTKEPWLDAVVFDSKGNKLGIQHKEIVWDPEYDKARSNAADRIVNELKKSLIAAGLNEFSVHLNFYQHKIISSKEDIDNFVFWLTEFIRLKSNDGFPGRNYYFLIPKTFRGLLIRFRATLSTLLRDIKYSFHLAFDQPNKVRQLIYKFENSDDQFLCHIKQVTSSIDIIRNPDQIEPEIGWGYSEPEPRPLPKFGDRVVSEIERKIGNNYNNVVVLLDCNRPIDHYDLKIIHNNLKNMPRDCHIWLVENFPNNRKATKLL